MIKIVGAKLTDGRVIDLDIDNQRLYLEEEAIYNFLNQIELEYNYMKWDGLVLKVWYSDGRVCETSRQELEEYISCLDLTHLINESDDELDPVNQYPLNNYQMDDFGHKEWW